VAQQLALKSCILPARQAGLMMLRCRVFINCRCRCNTAIDEAVSKGTLQPRDKPEDAEMRYQAAMRQVRRAAAAAAAAAGAAAALLHATGADMRQVHGAATTTAAAVALLYTTAACMRQMR
jgi:hypothetical protein